MSGLVRCGGTTIAGRVCQRTCRFGIDDWFCWQHQPNVRIIDHRGDVIGDVFLRFTEEELAEAMAQFPGLITVEAKGPGWAAWGAHGLTVV